VILVDLVLVSANVTIYFLLETYQTVLEAAVRWTISIMQKCSN